MNFINENDERYKTLCESEIEDLKKFELEATKINKSFEDLGFEYILKSDFSYDLYHDPLPSYYIEFVNDNNDYSHCMTTYHDGESLIDLAKNILNLCLKNKLINETREIKRKL